MRTGMDPRTAREHVRSARALAALPSISASMARGELSFSKIRALTRFATPESEGELLDYARMNTAAELERLGRSWNELSRGEETDRERRRYRRRRLVIFPDDDGMYLIRGRLPAEVGALLMRAVEAAGDALFREGLDWCAEGGARGPRTEEVTPEQRWADALGLLAERAMELGFGGGAGATQVGRAHPAGSEAPPEPAPSQSDDEDLEQVPTKPDCSSTSSTVSRGSAEPHHPGKPAPSPPLPSPSWASAPIRGTRAERYQVMIHVEPGALSTDEAGFPSLPPDPHGGPKASPARHPTRPPTDRSELDDGTRLSPETARRLACDASRVKVTRGPDGSVLDVGRRTRTVPAAILRALEIRDGGCSFPGCGLRFTEAHHVQHWADGGETKLRNLILLCRHHHRAVHEEGFTVRMNRCGRPHFFDRTGWPLPDFAPPPFLGDRPVEELVRSNRARGVDPQAHTAASRYRRTADVPWEVEARARDALEGKTGIRGT